MDGVNEELMEKLRKKFEFEGGVEVKQTEEHLLVTDKKLEELSRLLGSLKQEIILNRTAIEEVKTHIARIQVPPPAEVRGEDLRAIDKKLDQLSKIVDSLKSDIHINRQSIEDLKSHTSEIKTTFKSMTAAKVEDKKEEKEEELEERFVISPKTGVIEKVKGKKIDYIEAKPSTLKKDEKPKDKKGSIIEAEDNTPGGKGGSLFKRLKDIK